ncbi:MAG: sigma-54 dependent transcriptional regulator [Gemmatimonadota bacterium]|nr:sigma-54 dependent transcriptional regulator [Gemmatimonadota bacterium]
MTSVLYVDDDHQLGSAVSQVFLRAGYHYLYAHSAEEALSLLDRHDVDVVVSDQQMPHGSGMDLLTYMRERGHLAPVILFTAYGSVPDAVRSVAAGALEYLQKPLDPQVLVRAVEKAAALRRSDRELIDRMHTVQTDHATPRMLGESPVMRSLMRQISAAADSSATVLVEGETGTGKELVAKTIHMLRAGKAAPFIAINCAAIPESLIESVLFGHERGAFTGAIARTLGAFERANGGTLLLDEVSEMRFDLQAKLLRVLQERSFERVGGNVLIRANTRVVATTNRSLLEAVSDGRFRDDLYHRLNVVRIVVPPLRERHGDIPALARHFIAAAAVDHARPISSVSLDVLTTLEAYPWPGNLRQLQAVANRAVVNCRDDVIKPCHLELDRELAMRVDARVAVPVALAMNPAAPPETLNLSDAENMLISKAIAHTGGRFDTAAALLGIHPRTLRRKLARMRAPDDGSGARGDRA